MISKEAAAPLFADNLRTSRLLQTLSWEQNADCKTAANDNELQLPARYGQNGRVMAVGRNNWVFLGSDRGGKTMTVLRSFVVAKQ